MKQLTYLLFIVLWLSRVSFAWASGIPITIHIDAVPEEDWTINPLIFGSYSEEHWGDITPGIYEQYLVNPSFEEWFEIPKGNKTQLLWDTIPSIPGVAYPWENRKYKGTPSFELSKDRLNSKFSQQINVKFGDQAAIGQRLALPDYRTTTYKVKFYAKASGDISLLLAFQDLNENTTLGSQGVSGLTNEWKSFEYSITVSKTSDKWMNRYGIYYLHFLIQGSGSLLIDQVTIFPIDCIEGVYNPETVQYFKTQRVKMIRWPGGNFTSGYHWYDGIGPLNDRPTLGNRAWGGLNCNHVGTDEILRFCEITGITPVMGVGFGEITSEEVANWVEYCNGDASTPMGSLRVANGHIKPYNVKYWGVGNEVYGSYQIGHTNSRSYATGLVSMIQAMRAKDPNIQILASGYGVHNTYRRPNQWNKVVREIAGDHIDFFDVHQYVYGPTNTEATASTKEEIFRAFVASNFYLRGYIDNLRKELEDKDSKKKIQLAFLEWGVLPRSSINQTPLRQTFINTLCSAAQYNEMIRQADLVQMAALHNFSFYVSPVRAHSEPVNPRSILFANYAVMARGKILRLRSENMPVYNVTKAYEGIGLVESVPELDVLATRVDNTVFVTIINRSLEQDFPLSINIANGDIQSVSGHVYTSKDPFSRRMWTNSVPAPDKTAIPVTSSSTGGIDLQIPKLSFSFLTIPLKQQ